MVSLVWLRRDLRLHDHAALATALASGGSVQPVFVFDTDVLARFPNPGDRRLTFIAQTLCGLDAELRARGGRLLVFRGRAAEVIPTLAKHWGANVFAAEDYEAATRARDKAVSAQCSLTLVKDQLIFAPHEILREGEAYKVYTPYAKAWRSALTPLHIAEAKVVDAGRYADVQHPQALSLEGGAAGLLEQIGYREVKTLWPVTGAPERLAEYARSRMRDYPATRDMLAIDGTSRISPYLRFGLVSVRECMRHAAASDKWLSELIWREFYAMILYHFPESAHTEWNPKYRGLEWSRNMAHLEQWKAGMTGFPIVDAAMRQLLETGWMHNRARMIVASFLTKDLQIDWRLGEEHFAQYLMDYDLASNVGGWQWGASTGTDAQPYFRIFNPALQAQKFDPKGEYIRRYVPEVFGYPQPMVDHADAREKTLALFKNSDK